MRRNHEPCARLVCASWNSVVISFALALCLLTSGQPARAQTYTVIHNFTGGSAGAYPYAGLTIDGRGNLYGTTDQGGQGLCPPANNGCGIVFKMSHVGSGWVFNPIYKFGGSPDGGGPYGPVVFGPNGSLYGTTVGGGSTNCLSGCGIAYNLRPSPTACVTALCPWRETLLYSFQGGTDAYYPTGEVAFDASGDMYGTTYVGGTGGPGTVWKLTPSGRGWTESIAHNFAGGDEGGNPYGGVVFDNSGNMYVSAVAGGSGNNGAVDELIPAGSGWTEHTLYDFQGGSDGGGPMAGLLFAGGNLYGSTVNGPNNGGTVYELMPSGGGWSFSTIADLPTEEGPFSKLVADSAGNLYGTTQIGSGDHGTVFKLTRSGDSWTLTVLHHFTGGSDGDTPLGSVALDSSGNIYGTTLLGGTAGTGVVFEITP